MLNRWYAEYPDGAAVSQEEVLELKAAGMLRCYFSISAEWKKLLNCER